MASYPIEIVVQHHEGFGKPRNGVQLPHYSYIMGADEWHLRSDLIGPAAPKPGGDTSTIDFNRVVIGVVLTGNRQTGIKDNPAYPVTDTDIEMMREIGTDARSKGWLTENPTVKMHYEMPGSNTVCPGDLTIARRADIEAAYQGLIVPVPGDDMPKDKDFVDSCSSPDGAWKLQYDGGIETIRGKFFGSYFSLPAEVRNDPNRRFLSFFPNYPQPGYTLVSVKGEPYSLPYKP